MLRDVTKSTVQGVITDLFGSVWSISSIFAASEPGWMYDNSDMSTLFQDSAGTTPVTAVGQPVGLQLDKKQGLVLGPELVTNGDFSAGSTGWTVPAGWVIAGGAAVATAASGSLRGGGVSPVLGRGYRVEFNVVNYTSGTLFITVGGNFAGQVTLTGSGMSPGRKSIFVISGSDAARGVEFYGGAVTATIDNISVKEIAGTHRTQSTAASRPTFARLPVTGRRNLLTYTEQFDNTAWSKGANVTISSTSEIAPDGTPTAEKFSTSGASDLAASRIIQTPTTPSGSLVFSVWLRSSTSQTVRMKLYSSNGSVSAATLDVSVTSNWTRFQIAATGLTANVAGSIGPTGTAALAGIEVWGAQLELGSTATNYQKVVSLYDITEAGVQTAYGLYYDGVDDFMVTPTITPGTDKVQVFAGVRKLSDAATQIVLEFSTGSSNDGSFNVAASTIATAVYGFNSRGTVSQGALSPATFLAPITNVLAALGDISGDRATLRVNGTRVAQSTADQGTGNYLAYPVYFGRRGGTGLAFNGYTFHEVGRFGPNLDAATIANVENWINQATGAY